MDFEGNYLKDIFDDYEKWLQEDLLINDYQNLCLNESKEEMFHMFDEITKDLYKYAKWRGDKFNDKHTTWINVNIPKYNKYFIQGITLTIKYNKTTKEDGFFLADVSDYDFLSDKLDNVKIVYYEKKETPYKINEEAFYKSVFHELQHAYRHYNILQREDEKNVINAKNRTEYNLYYKFSSDPDIQKDIKDIYYFTNINEINSFMAEIYPYLKKTSRD